ncbi:MAG: hypothetical protein JXA46_17570 [Dehalococcoidales bacterium]|nr:hypothetical protein [Dehalococcoidales bacterium]
MPNRLIITLLTTVAVVIIGAAVYLAMNFSTLSWQQGIVLIAIAVAVLLICTVTLYIFFKNTTNKK